MCSSEVCVRWLLVFVSSWRLLAFSQNLAFDGKARQSIARGGIVVRGLRGRYQNGRPEIYRKLNRNDAKFNWKSWKINPKSTKMVPRISPKTIMEGSRFQDQVSGAPGTIFLIYCCATWAIFVDFVDPWKSEGVPKATQKIQYGDFLVHFAANGWKKEVLEGVWTKHEILIKNRCGNGKL